MKGACVVSVEGEYNGDKAALHQHPDSPGPCLEIRFFSFGHFATVRPLVEESLKH